MVLTLLACGSEKVGAPEAAVPSGNAAAEIIVSAPIPRASLPSGVDSSGSVVFVSAMPRALPGAVQVVVRGEDGQSASTSVIDGGFDPVEVAAASGDVVTATLTYANGETVSKDLAVRARRPPRVVRTSPAPQRTDVPLNVVIRVVFSAPVDLESARAGVQLTTGAGDVVPGTVEAVSAVSVDYVVTAGTLAPETAYRLDVTTDVRDVLGQPLAEPVSVEFRTGTASATAPLAPRALQLSIAPARINVVRGGSGQALVTIARGEAFTGAVALSASGMPSGVSVTFSPVHIEAGATTATMSVVVDSTVPPGDKAVAIEAVGDGVRAATAKGTLAIGVTAGSVSLTITPARIDLVQGGTAGQVQVKIARGGTFTGGVRLFATGFPSGVTVATGFINEGSTTATFDLWADAQTPPGIKNGVISAVADGVTEATATLVVAVGAPSGSVTPMIAPASINLVRGGAHGQVQVTIVRSGTFTGAVDVSALDAPVGVYVSSGSIDQGSTTATLDVAVDATAELGTKTVVISADGENIKAATATLVISAVAPSGAVSLVPEPDLLNVVVGASEVTSTIAVNRTGAFAGPVELAVTGMPIGVTATVSPSIATGASATLSVSAVSGAVNGTYQLQIHGRGTGIADEVTTVGLTISGGSPAPFTFDPTTVTVTAGGPGATAVLALSQRPTRLLVSTQPGLTAVLNLDGGTTATLTVEAGSAVAPGTYIITVSGYFFAGGEYAGRIPRLAKLPVVVSAAPALR